MIKPTIGRVVLYYPSGIQNPGRLPVPWDAHVARVWNDRLINVGGFDPNGDPYKGTSVILIQEGDTTPVQGTISYAGWMEYQIGQARAQGGTLMGKSLADLAIEEQNRLQSS